MEEGIKIFDAHRKFGNKWADITTLLPGRTDNTIKNYFYATVRRHLRKLNKCLRASKFWDAFNIEQKQVKISFLTEALETGELNYFDIRTIETKDLIALSKKKSTNAGKKLTAKEKSILSSINWKGKPVDKNIKLFKSMLSLIDNEFK